uniref:Uncharacterized protein n=1 Tax=Anopheles atroparvus TaxID=41427 RepID=A0AAG5D6V4_ANOAO
MSAHAIVLQPEKQLGGGQPLLQGLQQSQRRASYAFVTPEAHSLGAKRHSVPHQQIQKVQPMVQTQPQPPQQQQQQPVKSQPFQPLIKPQPPVYPQHYTAQPTPSCPVTPPNIQPLDMQDDTKSSSEGSCSTCDSDSEPELLDSTGRGAGGGEEREIFIDFKPRVSPVPSPGAVKKKKLQKAQSEGELMHAEAGRTRKGSADGDGSSTGQTASDDEGMRSNSRTKGVSQFEIPQAVPPPPRDYHDASESSVPDDEGPQGAGRDRRKESFRKRSVSLDHPTSGEQEADEEDAGEMLSAGLQQQQQQHREAARAHGRSRRASSRSNVLPKGAERPVGGRHLSAPPSPQKDTDRGSKLPGSPFHSSDSLANDVTRDTSDGNWNESQTTIMTTSLTDNGKLTPSSRRKNLLLQHQQRSSMDTDVLDMEDIADQPLPPLPVTVAPSATLQSATNVSITTTPTSTSVVTTTTGQQPNGTAGIGIGRPTTPSIAVIPSLSIEREERDQQWQKSATLRRPSRPRSPTKRTTRVEQQQQQQQKLSKIEPLVHRPPDSTERIGKVEPPIPTTPQQPHPPPSKGSHQQQMSASSPMTPRFIKTSPGNGIDLLKDHPGTAHESICSVGGGGGAGSEGSTTEDYVTCTDNSKRGASGAKATTQDGSSFESASSIYSLARVDAVCEETPPIEEKPCSPQIPPPPIPKPSPTHSVSSSSSDSFGVGKKSSPSRPTLPKSIAGKPKPPNPQSLSDDDRSEKRYSSSHDEKDPVPKGAGTTAATVATTTTTGTIARSARRGRDWNEEERRRKKSTFKLEFDKDSIKTYTTPMLRQPSPGFKKLSPEDKSALNVLDGASPSSKQKRFRPKTRKSPRARSAVAEETSTGGSVGGGATLPRRSKTPLVRSPEKPTTVPSATAVVPASVILPPTPQPTVSITTSKLSPAQYYSQIRSPPSGGSPRKQKISPEKRLQAISTESLRSVSPGSDSVFYSEADALSHCEHQVHCSHCGKEVEVANLPGESEESILTLDTNDGDRPDIVQPPEGFADSPDCTKTPHHTRLYKKMDKRFRSEDRHVDRRLFKSRQEYRAKSEERGKEEVEQNNLR